ncbi:lipopolysaccharide biosynthesis protein [Alsobacter sp. SYSU BS001988]
MKTRSGDYFFYLAATLAPRFAMFILLILLTRWLPVDQYGLFVLVVTVGEILDTALTNWIRIYSLRTEAGLNGLRPLRLGRLLVLSGGATTLGVGLSWIVARMTEPNETFAFWVALVSYTVGLGLVRFSIVLLQLAKRHSAIAVVEGVRAVAILVAVVAAADMTHSYFAPSLALSLASGLVAGVQLVLTLRSLARPKLPKVGYMAALRFGFPLIVTALLTWVMTWFDRLVINHYAGAAAVGLYAAAYAIGRQPIELFIAPLNSYTFPMLVRRYAAEGAAAAGRFQAGMLVTTCVLCVGAAACISVLDVQLAGLLLPPAYREHAVALLPSITYGAVMISAKFFVFDNAFYTVKRNDLYLISMGAPAVVGAVTSILMISRWGIDGAGMSFVITTSLSTLSSYVLSNRVLPMRLPVGRIAAVLASAAAASAALAVAETWFATWHYAAQLCFGGALFGLAYMAALSLFGVSLRGVLMAPWEQSGQEPTAASPDLGGAPAAAMGGKA